MDPVSTPPVFCFHKSVQLDGSMFWGLLTAINFYIKPKNVRKIYFQLNLTVTMNHNNISLIVNNKKDCVLKYLLTAGKGEYEKIKMQLKNKKTVVKMHLFL